MAGASTEGPIGPFPDGVETDEQRDEYDRMRRRALWTMPSGLYVVGSRAGDRRNLMTANWATQVSFEPKLLAVGVEKPALTHRLIAEGRVFSLSTIDREDRAIVRKFTKPVEVDLEADLATARPTGSPSTTARPARRSSTRRWRGSTARCARRSRSGDTTLFIGEIVGCGFQKAEDTPVLRMEDTRMNYGG